MGFLLNIWHPPPFSSGFRATSPLSEDKLLYAPARDEMNQPLIFGTHAIVKSLALALTLHLAGFSAPAQTLPTALNIVVLDGEGATGPVRQRPSHVPVVRVVDENQKPVSGATVVFTLPTEGATGEFPKGNKTLMVLTDSQGVATAQGLRFNDIPGKVPINVNVSYKGLTARSNIMQLSQAPAGYKPGGGSGGHTGKIIAILAVIGAGGAGAALIATHKNGSSSATTPVPTVQPIGITPGTGTLAPPH